MRMLSLRRTRPSDGSPTAPTKDDGVEGPASPTRATPVESGADAPDSAVAAPGAVADAPDAVAGAGPAPADGGLPDETAVPRWRRASLLAARKSDPAEPVEIVNLTFGDPSEVDGHGVAPTTVRYRLVRLLAEPDETRAAIVGMLDEGDEVLVVEARGLYRRVRCPAGLEGWVHRMTLEDPTPPS